MISLSQNSTDLGTPVAKTVGRLHTGSAGQDGSASGEQTGVMVVDDERDGGVSRVRAGYARIDALLAYLTENCCAGAATCGPTSTCAPSKPGASP